MPGRRAERSRRSPAHFPRLPQDQSSLSLLTPLCSAAISIPSRGIDCVKTAPQITKQHQTRDSGRREFGFGLPSEHHRGFRNILTRVFISSFARLVRHQEERGEGGGGSGCDGAGLWGQPHPSEEGGANWLWRRGGGGEHRGHGHEIHPNPHHGHIQQKVTMSRVKLSWSSQE